MAKDRGFAVRRGLETVFRRRELLLEIGGGIIRSAASLVRRDGGRFSLVSKDGSRGVKGVLGLPPVRLSGDTVRDGEASRT